MLARRLATILPPLAFTEALEVTKLYSIISLLPESAVLARRRREESERCSCSRW